MLNLLRTFRQKSILKIALFGALMLVGGMMWGEDYIWSQKANGSDTETISGYQPHGIYNWTDSIGNGNTDSIWKDSNNGNGWRDLNACPNIGETDRLLFSGEITAAVRLVYDIQVGNLILGYEQGGTHYVGSGIYPVTIDLNGHTLTCSNLILNNNGSYPVTLIITDSSAGTKGSFIVNTNFDFSDTQNHNITIDNGATLKINGTVTGAATGSTGNVTIDGDGTGKLELNDDVSNGDSIIVNTPVEGTHANEISTNIVWNGSAGDNKWETGSNWTPADPAFSKAISVTIPANSNITATGTVELPANSKLITGNTVSLIFGAGATLGDVELAENCSVISNGAVSSKNVSLGKSSSIQISGNFRIDGNYEGTAQGSVINCSENLTIGGGASFRGDLTVGSISVTGGTSFCGACSTVTSTNNQTYGDTVQLLRTESAVKLVSTNDGTINFTKDVRNWNSASTTPHSIIIGDSTNPTNVEFNSTVGGTNNNRLGDITVTGNAIFRGNVSAASISVEGTTTVGKATTTITTTGKQKYSGTVKINSNGDTQKNHSFIAGTDGVIFNSTVEKYDDSAKPNLIIGSSTNATNATFKGNITGLYNITIYGTTTFDSASAVNVETEQNQVYADIIQKSELKLYSNDTTAGTVTIGNITTDIEKDITIGTGTTKATSLIIKGNIGTVAKPIKALKVYGTTTIGGSSASSIYTKNSQTYTKALTLEKDLSLYTNNNIVYFQSSPGTLTKTLTLNTSAEFTGNNTFTNLVIGDGNQTSNYIITFKTADSTQVFTALTSNGNTDHPVTLTGPSTWNATVPVNATFKYTLVENSTSTSYLGLTQSEATVRDNKWVKDQVYSTVNWFSLSYVWQGTTTAWETPSNWKYEGGNTAREYPDSTSGNTKILIPNNCSTYPVIENDKEYKIKTLEIDSDASITLSNKNLTLTSTTTPLTNNGIIIFTNAGRIYNNATTPALIMDNTTGTVQYGTGTDTSSGTITNYGDTDYNKLVIASGTWTIEASGNNIKADSITVKSNGKIIMKNTVEIAAPCTNNGTISCIGNVTFKEEYNSSATNTFNAGSGTVTFNKNIDFSKTRFNNQGGTVVLEPTGASLTINGSSKFYNLICDQSAAKKTEQKTIYFTEETTQTVDGKLTLKGKQNQLLKLRSTSTNTGWNIMAKSHDVSYVDLEDSYNTPTSGYEQILYAESSKDSYNNINWSFPLQTYNWKGGAAGNENNWFTKENWEPASVPGIGANVIIPNDLDSYPVLNANVNLNGSHGVIPYNGTITIEAGSDTKVQAILDIADKNLTAGTITNNGLVRLEGISGQTISGTMENGTDSTVEYYNDTTVSFVWDGNASQNGHQFNRLLITGKTDISDAAHVTDTTEINTSKDVSLTGANIFGNGLNITEGGEVLLNSANGFVLTQTADSPLTTLTVNNKVDLASDLTAAEKQTYNGPVVLDVTLNIKAPELIFNSTIDSKTGSEALTVNGAVTFNGNMGDNSAPAKLTVDGTSLINASNIKTSTEQIFNDAVIIDESTTLTGSIITFNSTVDSKDEDESLTVAGNVIFNDAVGSSVKPVSLTINGDTLINTSSITTAESQTYKKAVTIDESTNLTGSTITFDSTVDAKDKDETLTVTGNATFNGNVGTTATLTDLTVTETSLINTAEIITSESQTYKKAVTVDKNTTLTGPTITFNSTVDAKDKNETLTVTGNATFNGNVGTTATLTDLTVTETSLINTAKIKTSDSQVYEKAVTIDESTTLTSSEITFNSTVDSKDGDETLTISGNVTFNEKVGSLSTPAELTVNGNTTTTTSNITTEGSQNYNGKLTAVNTLTLTQISDTGKITFTGEVTGAQLFIDGNTHFANGNNLTSDYVKIINTKERTWTSETKANLTTDLYVDCGTNTINLNGNLTATNIYMYNGNVTIGTSYTIESTKNFVVWGANYSAVDKRYSSSNIRFEYYKAEPFAYSINPENASTTFGELKGNITVNGNFYLNGTNLPSVKINVPDNSESNPELNTTGAPTEKQWGIPYAVTFNSEISGVTVNGGWLNAATAQGNKDNTGNTNIQFQVPQITKAYTVYDDVIYIAFNMPLENSNNEINTNLAKGTKLSEGGLWYNNKSYRFAPVAYTDADCSKPLDETKDLTQIDENGFYSFYIRTIHEADDDIGNPSTYWNTDADGKHPYSVSGTTAADSTDRNGYHHNITVDLSLLEGLFTAADGHTMSNNYGINYEADGITQAEAYSDTEDYCEPVLIAVYIGQENHEDNPSDQEHYDAHNFIELRYSEPVNIGDRTTTLKSEDGDTNIQTTATLGNITGNGTDLNATKEGLQIEGLVKFATGKLNAENKNDSSSPHALYRTFTTKAGGTAENQTHRIRLSIAGFVDGEIDSHKNWVGYIDYAKAPETGTTVNAIENLNILDLKNNILDIKGEPNHKNNNAFKLNAGIPNETLNPIYGTWDTLPPVFSTLIKAKTGQSKDEYEILPTGNGTVINKIELHILDGDYSEENKYFVFSHGWAEKLPSADPVSNYLYQLIPTFQAADKFGGSRAFAGETERTSGGIRYCSIINQQSAFKFTDKPSDSPNMSFNSIKTGATANYFSGTNDNAYPIPQTDDNLYISLGIPNSSFNYETTFNLSYDNSSSFITDLAGNRLKSHNNLKSIDRTPPDYSLTLAPIGTNDIYIIFTKTLETTNVKIMDNMGEYHSRDTLYDVLPEIIRFGTINGGWQEDSNMKIVSAQEFAPFTVFEDVNKDKEFTGVKLTLENPITLEDVTTKYMRIEFPAGMSETGTDAFTNLIGSRVTYIQSNEGTTYMQMYKAHPISDFAVNAINLEYAYDPDYTADDGTYMMRTPTTEDDTGSWAVHSWGKNQGNFGTLPYNEPVNIIANRVTADQTYTMYLANNPDAQSVSVQFNTDFDDSKRIWLPEITGNSPFVPLADALNTKFETLTETSDIDFDATETPNRTEYKITKEDITKFNWHAGDQIKFLFSLDGQSIMHTPSNSNDGKSYTGIYSPIFALRTESLAMPDVTTLDLWSFRLKDYTYQRGGVSIFNNVINVAKAEKTIIKVNMPKDGKLKVIVMTLDGNVIDYLENSNNATSGEHVYYWNGTNRNHNMVARGMYFIRIIGDGLDETRKVMCVNEK